MKPAKFTLYPQNKSKKKKKRKPAIKSGRGNGDFIHMGDEFYQRKYIEKVMDEWVQAGLIA